jgi:hypothetical protein
MEKTDATKILDDLKKIVSHHIFNGNVDEFLLLKIQDVAVEAYLYGFKECAEFVNKECR